jgi:pimeloyl-ACP methyl ester carboxylesterase
MRINFLIPILVFTITSHAQHSIDTTLVLAIGGIKQFISIKGKDRSKPLLLFLHGGPGNSVISYAEKFTYKLQTNFTVVQWDQRESGKTKELNTIEESLKVSQFENDTYELVKALLNQFGQPKLYLLGHSWGTYLGFYMAKNHPELLYAYVPICPMVNQLESERVSLKMMLDNAKQSGNKQETKELSTVKIPFENGEQLYYHRKWLLNTYGAKTKLSKNYVESWADTWLKVFNEASKENLIETTPVLQCPVYFFIGRKDYQTNANLTELYYKKLSAPKKGLYWFERSGHSLPSSEPLLLQNIIIEKILPATYY